jgi:hypothetical protein
VIREKDDKKDIVSLRAVFYFIDCGLQESRTYGHVGAADRSPDDRSTDPYAGSAI